MFGFFNESKLKKIEREYGHLAMPNLMQYIVMGMAVVYILDMLALPLRAVGGGFSSLLAFIRSAILRGQVWRIISFVIVPHASTPITFLITLYFFWKIGQSLEQIWGTVRFNLYYFLGVLGTVLGGFLTGYASNYYLNLSLFLAYAILNPDTQILLFYVLPVKITTFAYLVAASLLYLLIISPFSGKVAILMSLLNLFIFFGEDLENMIRNLIRRYKWKRDTKDQ